MNTKYNLRKIYEQAITGNCLITRTSQGTERDDMSPNISISH